MEAIEHIAESAHRVGKSVALFCGSGRYAFQMGSKVDLVIPCNDLGGVAASSSREVSAALGKVEAYTKGY